MAMDTAAKRKSAINVGLLFLRLGVIPDSGNLEAAQRLHVQGLYSGIASIAQYQYQMDALLIVQEA